MRRKILAALILVTAGMMMLTACTSSEKGKPDETQNVSDVTEAGQETETDALEETEQDTKRAGEETSAKVETSETQSSNDIWTGNYLGDTESISIRLNENRTLDFSFGESGISGTADVDGSEAVYQGDDDHIITFKKGEGLLSVTVSHAEGYDTSASPLNGTYVPSY